MPLPSEYVIEDALRSIDDVIVYRADHPIHSTVNVYLPDKTLPPGLARVVKTRLYQNGLQMRNLSLLNVPLVTKALEVSQNPNDPYIVTKYTEHDLEELISNGVTIRPKRMFEILGQMLNAIMNLAAAGWLIGRIHPRQVKLSQLRTGDVSFNVIESAEQQVGVTEATTGKAGELRDAADTVTTERDAEEDRVLGPTVRITQGIDETQTPRQTSPIPTARQDVEDTALLDANGRGADTQRQLRVMQRNIYILGNITYQLLFGRKYHSSDKVALTNIGKLGRRWRKTLEKALSQNTDHRYDTYEMMLKDVRKALNRNRQMAIASIPFLLVLALIGGYFAYRQYRRHKIMTSPAGQAIESFLEIVDETEDDFPELKKPEPAAPAPDDRTILKPFDEVEAVGED